VGLQRDDVAAAVIRVFRGLVGVVGRGAVRESVDGLGDSPHIIVVIFLDDAARVGGRIDKPGVGVGGVGEQDGIGSGRRRRWPGIRAAAIGADVHRVGQAVGLVVIHGDVADAGLGHRVW